MRGTRDRRPDWVRQALAGLPDSDLEADLSVRLAVILLMLGTGARRDALVAADP